MYYRVSDLVMKWEILVGPSSDFISEFKDGYVPAKFTASDFAVANCKMSVIEDSNNFLE